MLLIADSGATKTEWCAVSASGNERVKTQGISPYFHTPVQIAELLRSELLPHLPQSDVSRIFYYGTGCTSPQTAKVVTDALKVLFPAASINVSYDLVGAAHALCGNSEGIACILGTGSSSGYYNGRSIEKNIAGLGYVLGDEGSGAYIGKMFAAQYLYGKLDKDLADSFEKEFNVTPDTLLSKIYSEPFANRLLASYSYFLHANRRHPQVEIILKKGLGDFFAIHISEYEQCKRVPVHFTGSISFVYRDIIMQLCKEFGFTCGNIIKEPMDGLLEYYQQQKAF